MKVKPNVAISLLLILILCLPLYAGTVGKIAGVITDKETGAVLPGVAVSIVGTSIGALTDVDGKYFILNVAAGIISLRAEIIGYAPVEMQNLNVSVDLTTTADFQLSSKILVGEVQTVIAERPLIIRDQTASLRVVGRDEIQQMPTRGYQDVVGLSSGVVASFKNPPTTNLRGNRENTNSPLLYVRGGRQGEVAYYVDGFSQQDPLTNLSTTAINNNAIDEISISTGGFNAEYGWVSSGAINVTTREGGKFYKGTIEGVSDGFMPSGDRYDYNEVAFNLDGPIFPNNDKASFFVSANRKRFGDRTPKSTAGGIQNHNSLSNWSWQGKIKYDINKKNVLRLSTVGSREDWKEFNMNYYFDHEHGPRYLDENYSYNAKWTNTLSPKTFFELGGSYFLTKRIRGDDKHWDDLVAYGRTGGNSDFYRLGTNDNSGLFWQMDTITLVPDTIFDANNDIDTIVMVDDGVDEGHVWEDFLKRRSSYVGGNFDIVSQINKFNEMKFGLEYQTHRLRYYDHLDPTLIDTSITDPDLFLRSSYQDANAYGYDITGQEDLNEGLDGVKKPYTFAAYLQDKFEWQGLVVNAGVRYDYLNVNTKRLRDIEHPLDPDRYQSDPNATPEQIQSAQRLDESDLEESKAEQKISPRLGVGFPVTDKTVFHVSYGKFFQRPELQYLYVGTAWLERMVRDAPYYAAIGNPNLGPEETIAYEVGLAHQLGDFTSFNATAYFKDVKALTVVVNQPSAPNAFGSYRNEDFGSIKGLDLQFKMRRTRGIAGELNYALSFATGTGSYATTQSNLSWTNSERPLRAAPLEFDQRHDINAVLDVRSGAKQGPKFGEMFPLENAGINFVFKAASGTPYTPTQVYNEVTIAAVTPIPAGRINSRTSPWTYQLDLKANKTFQVARLNLDVYVWVINLFDTENAINVYEGSGQANNTLWLATAVGQTFLSNNGQRGLDLYNLKQQNPNNYDTPRQVRMGLRVNF